ncbi:hypothetical protein ACWCXL_12120 [Streptomyces sp. NPDC001588]
MDDQPKRPPRPDEEELLRFHNGDTLESIPVIRLPEAPAPTPTRSGLNVWALGLAAVGAAVVGGLAAIGAVQLAHGGTPKQPVEAASSPEAVAAAPSPTTAAPTPASKPSPSTTASRHTATSRPSPSGKAPGVTSARALEQVRIIEAPATGGDPSTTYCLVYTGSESAGQREAILLANAPAYQCTDLLEYDPVNGSLHESPPVCEPPSRTAQLTFDPSSSWGDAMYFACVGRNHGA